MKLINRLRQLRTRVDWWIVGILFLALVGRVFYFNYYNVPALNQDESALLLNARLIAESGVDEWGKSWPLNFKSFGDFKLPGYIYLTSLLGSLIGFSNWTVRLPSFIGGIINIYLVYVLGKKMFGLAAARGAAAFLLFSPWGWHYSSIGFEANLGLMFFLVTLSLTFNKIFSWKRSIFASFFLLLSGLTYNSPLLLSPLIILVSLQGNITKSKRQWLKIIPLLLAIVLVVLISLPATMQKTGISIFSDPTLKAVYPEYRLQFGRPLLRSILGNQWVFYAREILKNTYNSFSYDFLVLRGGQNPWHTLPGVGHLHFWLPIIVAAGLGIIIRKTLNSLSNQKNWLVLGLFFGSLVPAVITVDAPHATRSLFFFVMLTLISGTTIANIRASHASKFIWWMWSLLFIVLLSLGGWQWGRNLIGIWESPQVDSHWYLGLENRLEDVPDDNFPVYILDPDGILYARVANFFSLSSEEVQATVVRSDPDTAGLQRVEKVGRYHFVFRKPMNQTGWYLFPRNDQEWSMIKL